MIIGGGMAWHLKWSKFSCRIFLKIMERTLTYFPNSHLLRPIHFWKSMTRWKLATLYLTRHLQIPWGGIRWHKVAYSGIWHNVSVRNLSNLPWQEGSKIVPDIMEKARNGVGTKWGEWLVNVCQSGPSWTRLTHRPTVAIAHTEAKEKGVLGWVCGLMLHGIWETQSQPFFIIAEMGLADQLVNQRRICIWRYNSITCIVRQNRFMQLGAHFLFNFDLS